MEFPALQWGKGGVLGKTKIGVDLELSKQIYCQGQTSVSLRYINPLSLPPL